MHRMSQGVQEQEAHENALQRDPHPKQFHSPRMQRLL